MDNKKLNKLIKAKTIAQNKPWWSKIFYKAAKKRSDKSRIEWEQCCEDLIPQADNFAEAWQILCLCQTSSNARDRCITKAADMATNIKELDQVLSKTGLNSPARSYIDFKISKLSSTT